MSATDYDSRTADKFVVRLPDGLRAEIEAAANASDRSMNSVFVQAVRQYLDGQNRQQILLNALAQTVASPVKSMHIDDRVKLVGSEPALLTVVFELPSLNDAHPLIAQLPYGQKALGTEAVVFGLTTGNLMEDAPCAD
ncbi:CopG family ribbon-helix-helix protein [Pseudomonas rhodesiae]|uniref:CopG family ribbon-helix-helix protein n=1 Tax=Pseudomonas rhodesiae TaxID=76760 RepID=UPI0021CC7EF5